MIRLFQTHEIRPQTDLEGFWSFQPVAVPELPTDYGVSLTVPGCWEQHPGFLNYRGWAAYQREITMPQAGNYRLTFKGVSHTAKVYVDGQLIAEHYNAYTPFSAAIRDAEPGKHRLEVLVDNGFSERSALHVPNDYYTYGGIIRPVYLEKMADMFIERIEFAPAFDGNVWRAEIKIVVCNIGNEETVLSVNGVLSNVVLNFANIVVKSGDTAVLTGIFCFPNIKAWGVLRPSLYLLKTVLFSAGLPVDDLIERVGFREIKIEEESLLLNGEKTKLKGFCRHEDSALFGCALPVQLMAKDLDLMRDMAATAVRTSHYPNDERFLDLCDERGILVWEENHARGLSLNQMLNPTFERQCEDCNREMVTNHFNHSSVIIWGLLNECASDTPQGREIYRKQIGQIRAMDQSRPVTFSSCKFDTDICLDLADIVSFNLYYGWYNNEEISAAYQKQLQYIHEHGGAGKPIIISEFGAAALYGMRDRTRARWSEEFQSDLLEKSISFYLNRPEINGTFIWQFCDCRITEEGDFYQTRPGVRNNKGVVDTFRRPKLAYDTVKKQYEQF